MTDRLGGKVALVTGAAIGIGRACAVAMAREGATVVVTDILEDEGRETVRQVESAGGKAVFLSHDVTSEDAWISVIDSVRDQFSKLDVLVNNAGIAIAGPVEQVSLSEWRRQHAINVEGVFLGVKHALPLMRAGAGGSIINLSSVAGLAGSPNMAAYCASKGAVRLFTKAVAMECAALKDGVRVNSVHPGIIETAIWTDIGKGLAGGDNAAADLDLDAVTALATPLGVKGFPADIAAGVVYLASDESRYVTGSELVIDGGMTAR